MEVQVGFNFREEDKKALREAHERRLQQEQEQHLRQMEHLRALDTEGQASGMEDKASDADAGSHGTVMEGKRNPESRKDRKTDTKSNKTTGAAKAGKPETVGGSYPVYGDPGKGAGGRGSFRRSALHASKDPEVFYGRNCEGEVIPISEIQGEIGEAVVHGQVIKLETREIRNEKTIVTFHITDFSDTISGKVFLANDDLPVFLELFQTGGFYRIKGIVSYDTFANDITIGSGRISPWKSGWSCICILS